MSAHQCFGEDCRTCKKQPRGVKPLVKDCWYDVPYTYLEGFLRVLVLMAILLLLSITIHLTVGQISTLKPFSSFLERAHLITDASELGILGKPSKEEGLYSPHQYDKDESEQSGMEMSQHSRNASKLQDLPMDIYKGTDDDDAYFITFRELCDDKLSPKVVGTEASVEVKAIQRQEYPKHVVQGFESIYGHLDSHQFQESNGKTVRTAQIKADDKSETLKNHPTQNGRTGSHQNVRQNEKTPIESVKETPTSNAGPELHVRDMTSFENYMRMRVGMDKNSKDLRIIPLNSQQNHKNAISDPKTSSNGQEFRETIENEAQQRQIPNLKLLLGNQPKSVLDMKIDLNNLNPDDLLERYPSPNKNSDDVLDGISIEDEEMQSVSADEAKNFLKEKISRQLQSKENEILGRLEVRSHLKPGVNIMEVEGNDLAGLNISSLGGRRSRAVENIDRSITYTEHERTMKQEVEVTYKRAQDIAKAILKTSEAIANSLDLCRKPMSTNFISDEPLTEAEDIIDQIVGQLKESLELTMGCRTCVKPHKDLMLFLRWLIFDDVSVKLCPSKPKAADLRKNYLLFNHDNAFLGRVCSAGEYPRAPINCSITGETKSHGDDEGEHQSKPHAKQMSKSRHRSSNANGKN